MLMILLLLPNLHPVVVPSVTHLIYCHQALSLPECDSTRTLLKASSGRSGGEMKEDI